MANFDEDIKRITEEILTDGTTDKIIREKVTKGFESAIDDAFRFGELEKAIRNRVTSIMVPFIEEYDMSQYITKLDMILTDIVNTTRLTDNKKILENFRYLITEQDIKEIKLSEIFKEYQKFVARNMDTYGRDVICDDEEPYYEPMEVYVEFEKEEDRSWNSFKHATIELSVDEEDQQSELNRTIRVSRYKDDRKAGWEIYTERNPTITSLRYTDEFDLFLVKLEKAGVRLIDDIVTGEETVRSKDEPECTWE